MTERITAVQPVEFLAGTNIHSSALEKSHVISAVACRVRSIKTLNNTVGSLWLHVFDLAALPANGTAPSRCPVAVGAGSVASTTWEGTTSFATGCVAALSSTLATLTLVATADAWFDAEVVTG